MREITSLTLADAAQASAHLRALKTQGDWFGATTEHLLDGRQESWVCLEPDKEMATALSGHLPASLRGVPISVIHGTVTDLGDVDRFHCIL